MVEKLQTNMPDRRGSQGSVDDLLPDDFEWARAVWADREAIARLHGGPWMLRHAAKLLGMDQGEVDSLMGG